MHLLRQFWCPLIICIITYFSWMREGVFCRNGQRILAASYFEDKGPVATLLYYQYYYSLSFIYFVILLFPCFIILASVTLSDFFCVFIKHFFWCWVTLWLTLDNFLYFISFLFHPFIRHCLPQSQFTHIFYTMFYVVFMCRYWP